MTYLDADENPEVQRIPASMTGNWVLLSSRLLLGFVCPVQAPQYRRHCYIGGNPGKATRIVRGLKDVEYEKRLRELNLLSLKKRWKEGGNLTAIYSYLM